MAETQTSSARSLHVLFADDDALVRATFARVVKANGWQVDLVSDGERAIALASQRSYDVIVTDHQMPGLCGAELIARLREISPSAGLVLVTGNSELAVESCKFPGLFVVISKPWDNQALLSLLAASARHRARTLESG